MISVSQTKLKGVLQIIPDGFEDYRGQYVELYNERDYLAAGIDVKFVQDDYSISSQNVLRGLHGDGYTWKLVSCAFGKLMLAVVNCDPASDEYCKWETFILTQENRKQILVPPKFANGHLILSERAIFHYKQSSYYSSSDQFSFRFDDPKFNIHWPIKNPIMSLRDQKGAYAQT